MVERGFEEPQRTKLKHEGNLHITLVSNIVTDTVYTNYNKTLIPFSGAMNLYRTHLQKRQARKRRMVIQYEHHIMRLRALTKVKC